MIPRRALLAAPALFATPARAERQVADATGRRIAVPDSVTRVFPAGPPAAILLYTLAPELLAGWPARPPRPAEAAFMLPEAAALPEIGRLTGRDNTANIEAVLRQRPDLVLDYGSVRPVFVSLAERVQAQTGLPTLLLDGALPQSAPLIQKNIEALSQVGDDAVRKLRTIGLSGVRAAAERRRVEAVNLRALEIVGH
jgi:iron complex transport system substrate-binding protein